MLISHLVFFDRGWSSTNWLCRMHLLLLLFVAEVEDIQYT